MNWPFFWTVRVPCVVLIAWTFTSLLGHTYSIVGGVVWTAIMVVINVLARARVDRDRRAQPAPVELVPGQAEVAIMANRARRWYGQPPPEVIAQTTVTPKGNLRLAWCEHGDLFLVDDGDYDDDTAVVLELARDQWWPKVRQGGTVALVVRQR